MNSYPHFHHSAAAAAGEGLDIDEGLQHRSKRLKLTHEADEVASPFPFLGASDVINIEPPLFPPSPSPPQHCYVCYKTFTSSEALHRHMRRHHPSPTWPGEAPPSLPLGAERYATDSILHLSRTQSNARRLIFPSWQQFDGNRASQEGREYGPKHN